MLFIDPGWNQSAKQFYRLHHWLVIINRLQTFWTFSVLFCHNCIILKKTSVLFSQYKRRILLNNVIYYFCVTDACASYLHISCCSYHFSITKKKIQKKKNWNKSLNCIKFSYDFFHYYIVTEKNRKRINLNKLCSLSVEV